MTPQEERHILLKALRTINDVKFSDVASDMGEPSSYVLQARLELLEHIAEKALIDVGALEIVDLGSGGIETSKVE